MLNISAVIIILTRKRVKIVTRGLEMEYSNIYVRRIRQLCKERGFAINMLAKRAGINQSTIDNIVRGLTKDPRVSTLHKIALAFNMTLAEFLDFTELNDYAFDEE